MDSCNRRSNFSLFTSERAVKLTQDRILDTVLVILAVVIAAFCVCTATAGACEKVDTMRYYIERVDTCLTCPDCMRLEIHDTLHPHSCLWDCERWCVRDTLWEGIPRVAGLIMQRPDTTLKPIWSPKVQVWLTPEQLEQLYELLEGHTAMGPVMLLTR